MWLKLLIVFLLIYWGGKLIKNLLISPQNNQEIKGNPRKDEPIDLSNYDVEDADFEEIDE